MSDKNKPNVSVDPGSPEGDRSVEMWRCPKCGAWADERFDCCEVHAETSGYAEVGGHKPTAEELPQGTIPSQRRFMPHLDVKDFMDPATSSLHVAHHSAPEPYEGKSAFGGTTTGVLQDRNRGLNLHENPQTLAERALPIDDRPSHYNPGMPASICEVYYPSKSRPTWEGVTCKACLSLKAKSGRP